MLFSFAVSETINIPDDYLTIQAGIDAAMEGDTILVAPDTYYETLVIEKTITLASHAILDIEDLEDGWVIETEDGYDVSNDIIASTIINGSNSSVIFINSPPGLGCITPEVFGFTIEDGSGTITLVDRVTPDGELYQEELNMGGGIFVHNALPAINYNLIQDCECDRDCTMFSGGGIQLSTGVNFPTILNIQSSNYRCDGDLNFTNNIFLNNDATYGSSISSENFPGYIDLSNSTFEIYDSENEGVPEYFVSIDSNADGYDTSGGQGKEEAIAQEVWVSPTGDDNNSGLTPETALQSIDKAIERLYVPQGEQGIIKLTEGYFNTSSYGSEGISLISNIALVGEGADLTIIGQNGNGYPYRIFQISNVENTTISNLTITGGGTEGYPDEERVGGAIKVHDSNLYLDNLLIKDNFSIYGGSLNFLNSNVILNDVHIKNNQGYSVVGIQAQSTNELHELRLINSSITNNQNIWGSPIGSTRGLAIRSWDNSIAIINSTISNNNMTYGNGNNLIPNPGEPGTLLFLSYGLQSSNPFGATANIYNSIIWDNHTSDSRDDVSYAGIPTYIFSSRTESSEWVGYQQGPFPALFSCIDNNPEFVNPNNGDYNLNENSPCIDSGRTNLGSFGMVENYSGLAPDMGAFEFCSSGIFDCLGTCNGDAIEDCTGECDGTAELDECGECNGPGLNNDGCCGNGTTDCNGDCDGTAIIDECGLCGGPGVNPINNCCGNGLNPEGVGPDCSGYCGGDAVEDCGGICGGGLSYDECGVCGGGGVADLVLCECVIGGVPNVALMSSSGCEEMPNAFQCFATSDTVCDCDGSIFSGCDNTCGSNLEFDDCGECGGINECIIAGDINFDESIDILDIVLLLNYIIGTSEFNEEQLVAADYTGDSIINILDIVSLVNFIVRD